MTRCIKGNFNEGSLVPLDVILPPTWVQQKGVLTFSPPASWTSLRVCGDKGSLFDQALVRLLEALFLTRLWCWASVSVLVRPTSPSFSKNPAKSIEKQSPTLYIWSPLISNPVPHPPPLISVHPGLPSARILSSQLNQNLLYPMLPLWNILAPTLLLGYKCPLVHAVFATEPSSMLRSLPPSAIFLSKTYFYCFTYYLALAFLWQ